MSEHDDRNYFERRARQERAMASVSEDNSVALAHLKMADAYERKLAAGSETRRNFVSGQSFASQ